MGHYIGGLVKESEYNPMFNVQLKTTGGRVQGITACWGSSSTCRSMQGAGDGWWTTRLPVTVKAGRVYRWVVYYKINGVGFKHVLDSRAIRANPNAF
ncbi:MAG: hypothetical protein WCK82_14100 [Bacteroidota bacterium]